MRLCKDCKWMKVETLIFDRPAMKSVMEIPTACCESEHRADPVTGDFPGHLKCRDARAVGGFCGRDGKHWEARNG